ncbi:MAG: glycogen debranching protein GlgX [Acidobacteriota bacterium]|nr:MAG: glycogen debranching protein GlgX [Acidobacteriota bacterium]
MKLKTSGGMSAPLGSTVYPHGVNFSLYSKSAVGIELLLFENPQSPEPLAVIPLCPRKNRTFHYWHVFVHGLRTGQTYGYRVHGPWVPEAGHRFDGEKLLIDPYGRCVVTPDSYDRALAEQTGETLASAMRSVVTDPSAYDWEGDHRLNRPFSRTVIYEMHVKGFTQHQSSGVSDEKRGTYLGLIEKIPYLLDLGVTAVELLPIFQFDEQEAAPGLTNYWGYNPVSFFAPHAGYGSAKDPLAPINEFRDMVKALHRAGLEVILDVVFNHTAEGNERGPTFSFRGLENSVYYILESDRSRYANYSGTGNTLNANNSIVRRMIIDSLHYWVEEMHVDGFRFDLASILSRDPDGTPMADPPILWDIESDPILSGTKLIAEAWDAAGLYQVGTFVGDRWKEWNGKFRDELRGFFRGESGKVPLLKHRLLASPDIYGHKDREPEQSINFITCHDGFTLNDLVSYNEKHNEANGENNRDGTNYNLSWNCGVEGPTDDPEIEALRNRQIKNFLTITLLSLGVPMILMGDEARRTQLGNNNSYCQDNETSWFDWGLLDRYPDIHRFVKRLIKFRLTLDAVQLDHGMSLLELIETAKVQWHGVNPFEPDYSEDSRSLAFSLINLQETRRLYVALNAFWEPLEFRLPPTVGRFRWRKVIDTALSPPNDISDLRSAPVLREPRCLLQPRSVAVLVTKFPKKPKSKS